MNGKNNLALLAVVGVMAVALLVAFAVLSTQESKTDRQIIVNLPDYLQKSDNSGLSESLKAAGSEVISFAADSSGTRLLSVSGSVMKTAAPDKASVFLSVSTLDKSASKSQSDNAELADRVITALKNAGIPESDIKTSSYNLNEEFQWNDVLRKNESIGYRTTNSIQVTVKDLQKVGSIIDAAVQAGANSVSSVSFELSQAKQDELKTQALKEAAQNAKAKAESIALGLGITVGRVYSASESSNYYVPVYRNYAMEAVSSTAGATTPITPGDIEFSASVSVQFEIQ